MTTFGEQYDAYKKCVEDALQKVIEETDTAYADTCIPKTLADAMRYSLLAGGKRLRPVMLLAACDMAGGDCGDAMPFAVGLEMIHTYSLIHDDLPAMDNDVLRRGKPTNHVVYGEAVAILAGDGLLNLAYETMSASQNRNALAAIREISVRAGVTGMVAGQTLDVTMEKSAPEKELVAYIQRHKTADLLTAPIVSGMLLAGAEERALCAGRIYGQNIGLAFQIIDDILDETSDAGTLGKTPHKDKEEGKLTWTACVGLDEARRDAQALTEKAIDALEMFGDKADFLKNMARDMLRRVK